MIIWRIAFAIPKWVDKFSCSHWLLADLKRREGLFMPENSLKKLVVFYSFEGNTRFVAETIAAKVGADLLELQPQKEISTHGFMKYFWGGRQATMKVKPELLPLEKDPDDYDLIYLGTPVWAFTFAPPVRTFLTGHPPVRKKIALFCCYEGGLGKTFENLRTLLTGSEILSEKTFLTPLRKKTETQIQAEKWAEEVAEMAKGGQTVKGC
jgi:flavodoxin